MMDGSMYPNNWHPLRTDMDRFDVSIPVKHYTRSERPPRYYLIDFGISRRYDPQDGPPLEPIIFGGDKTVPEFRSPYAPCNPFHTDIYYMGNFIRSGIMKVGKLLFDLYWLTQPPPTGLYRTGVHATSCCGYGSR